MLEFDVMLNTCSQLTTLCFRFGSRKTSLRFHALTAHQAGNVLRKSAAMKLIKLGHKRKYAIVDDSDFEMLSRYAWHGCGGYAATIIHSGQKCSECGRRKSLTILMHRLLMSPPTGKVVDHINRNKLDNRRQNLRVCTPIQNHQNKRHCKNKLGIKGVYENGKGYISQIMANGKVYYLGKFKTIKEASFAYDSAAIRYHGEFANTNASELKNDSTYP